MTESNLPTRVTLGLLGALSLAGGLVAALLGVVAWFLSHQTTDTVGLAVMVVVFFQWIAALVGGYIVGGPVAAHGSTAARVGVILSITSVVVTGLALISYYWLR